MIVEQSYAAERAAAKAEKALTETEERTTAQPAPSPPSSSDDKLVATSPPEHSRFVWSKKVRPGPNDVLTWEEAMRVPWIEGNEKE
jgi:hypothetical protein